jgi:hypothetical protein
MNWNLLGLIVGLILTIVGIALSYFQLYRARGHAETLRTIQDSLSTRFIGEFPSFLSKIVELIQGARQSITIVCDFPAYARFSDPANWREYRHEIERKIQDNVRVSITCLNAERRLDFSRKQFSRERNWDEWKRRPDNEKKLLDLANTTNRDTINNLTQEGFYGLMEQADLAMLGEQLARAEKREINSNLPLYFWLVDEQRAIFAIPSYSDQATEYGFITYDPKLISAFKEMTELYLAEPPSPERTQVEVS